MKKTHCSLKLFVVLLLCFQSIVEVKSQQLQFLPPIPYYSTNPYKTSMWKGLQLTNPTVVLDFGDADELQLAALAYMHPQSPYFMGATTYTRLITLLDSTLTDWYNGNKLADITNSFQGCFAYDMLKTLYPTKIPSNRKAIWEAGIRKQIDSCYKSAPNVYVKHLVRDVWLNGHQRTAMAMFFGGNALGDSIYQEYGRYATEEIFTQCLLEDGGTHYLSYHNEASTYHPIVVKCFLDYWLATQSTKVYALLKGLVHFAPLSHHVYKTSNGYSEYTTGPSNKCYYNGLGQTYPAAVSAFISNDGYNYTIGKNNIALELGFIYQPGVIAKPLPDNYMVYDANTFGPRGKYGNWSVVGTTRDPSSPLPAHPQEVGLPFTTLCEGKATFVGAYMLDSLSTKWQKGNPLNAAFHAVAPAVKIRKGNESEWGRGNTHSWLTVNEHNALSKSRNVYGISTRYQFNKAGGRMATIPWEGMQQWVVTEDRIVGMIELQAMQKQSVYGLKTRILLVSGRKGVMGTRKSLTIINPYAYEYGMIKTKIHSENFKGIIDTQYVNIINFTTDDDYSAEIELHDKLDSAKDKLITYAAGTKRYALIEVTNTTKTYSTATVYPLKDTGLTAFQFQEQKGRKIRMVHNITSQPIVYNDTMYAPFRLATMKCSWNDSVFKLNSSASFAICGTTIPAYGHILLISSNDDSEHYAHYFAYNDVFIPSATLPVKLNSFIATNKERKVLLNWSTSNEWNNHHFSIQRSLNGIEYQEIGAVNANNEIIGTIPYQFVDEKPLNVNAYYQLIQYDKDGKSTNLGVRMVMPNVQNNQSFNINPNPSNTNTFNLNVGIDMLTNVKIEVHDVSGKLIYTKRIEKNANKIIPISLPENTPAGSYLVSICNGSNTSSQVMVLN